MKTYNIIQTTPYSQEVIDNKKTFEEAKQSFDKFVTISIKKHNINDYELETQNQTYFYTENETGNYLKISIEEKNQ